MDIPPTNTNENLIPIPNPPNIVNMTLYHPIEKKKKLSMINCYHRVNRITNHLNERLLLRRERRMIRVNDQVTVQNLELVQISNFSVRNPANERKNRWKRFINKRKILVNQSKSNARKNHPVDQPLQIINDIVLPPPTQILSLKPNIHPVKHSMPSNPFLYSSIIYFF